MKYNSEQYKKVCEGVLLLDGESEKAKKIIFKGKSYELFLDYFYLDRPLANLTETQVTTICGIRESIQGWRDQDYANNIVRSLFTEIILRIGPETVFEVGPGAFPLFTSDEKSFNYLLGELDEKVVEKNKVAGYNIFHFNSEADLPIPDDSVDMIFGVFVFQFNFSDNQIQEMERILSSNGGLLANIYHRTDTERKSLIDKFKSQGLAVTIISDPNNLCRQHQYWIVSKSEHRALHGTCSDVINSSNC